MDLDPFDTRHHVAVHEAGHAVACHLYGDAWSAFCGIAVWGDAVPQGRTVRSSVADRHTECRVRMAGLAAQELILGCSRPDAGIDDIVAAALLCRAAYDACGFKTDDAQFYKNDIARSVIDYLKEIRSVLEAQQSAVNAVAEALLCATPSPHMIGITLGKEGVERIIRKAAGT